MLHVYDTDGLSTRHHASVEATHISGKDRTIQQTEHIINKKPGVVAFHVNGQQPVILDYLTFHVNGQQQVVVVINPL